MINHSHSHLFLSYITITIKKIIENNKLLLNFSLFFFYLKYKLKQNEKE
jgi:hypothetical protein